MAQDAHCAAPFGSESAGARPGPIAPGSVSHGVIGAEAILSGADRRMAQGGPAIGQWAPLAAGDSVIRPLTEAPAHRVSPAPALLWARPESEPRPCSLSSPAISPALFAPRLPSFAPCPLPRRPSDPSTSPSSSSVRSALTRMVRHSSRSTAPISHLPPISQHRPCSSDDKEGRERQRRCKA